MAVAGGLDAIAAEAFLAAIQAQTHDHGPAPLVYRDEDDLRDVQFVGQIDVLAAMRAAILAMRESDEDMEEAGSRYLDEAQHIAVDGIWSTMIDAILSDGPAMPARLSRPDDDVPPARSHRPALRDE